MFNFLFSPVFSPFPRFSPNLGSTFQSDISQPQSHAPWLPASALLFGFKSEARRAVSGDAPRTPSAAARLRRAPLRVFGAETLRGVWRGCHQAQAEQATRAVAGPSPLDPQPQLPLPAPHGSQGQPGDPVPRDLSVLLHVATLPLALPRCLSGLPTSVLHVTLNCQAPPA